MLKACSVVDQNTRSRLFLWVFLTAERHTLALQKCLPGFHQFCRSGHQELALTYLIELRRRSTRATECIWFLFGIFFSSPLLSRTNTGKHKERRRGNGGIQAERKEGKERERENKQKDTGMERREAATDIEADGAAGGWIDKQDRDGGAPPS